MNLGRLACAGLALASASLTVLALPAAARAQERPRIEIVHDVDNQMGIVAGAFSGDSAFVLAGRNDGLLELRDARTARLLRTITAHSGRVSGVALSHDGTRAVSAAGDGIKLWDTATGRGLLTISMPLDVTDRELLKIGLPPVDPVTSVALSPDGRYLLSGDNANLAKLWETATGRLVRSFRHDQPRPGWSAKVAFAADGARVVTGGPGDSMAKVWETATGRLLQAFGTPANGFRSGVGSVAFSPDGTHVMIGTYESLTLWDAATGSLVRDFNWGRVMLAHSIRPSLSLRRRLAGGARHRPG